MYEYVHGDKDRALLGLGHALHMVEDMAVPPHTRNDQHLSFVDESPYEKWASRFTPENITTASDLIKEGKTPRIHNSISDYMSHASVFTNSHFFSKDTLPFSEAGSSSIPENRYPIPVYSVVGIGMLTGGEMQSFGVSKVGGESYRLFDLRESENTRTSKITREYRINKVGEEELILSDYWDILSKEAVLNGAGVVKLFFDEVEKEKETLALYNKNKSWFAKMLPKVIAPQYTKGDLTPQQNLASVSDAFIVNEQIVTKLIPEIVLNESLVEAEEREFIDTVEEEIIEGEVVAEGIQEEDVIPEWQKMKISVSNPGFGGDGGASKAAQDAANEAEETVVQTPDAPVISSPSTDSSFATSSITFSGTASSASMISQDFSSATTTVDVDGNWSITLPSFSQGTTTLAFTASNSEGQSSESASVSVFVDTVVPVFDSFSVLECTYSLRTDSCLAGDTTVNLAWSSSSSDISHYAVVLGGSVSATTSDTSATAVLTDEASTGVEIVAYDVVGNVATSSSQTVEVFDSPVVINEVAWAGTKASASDEWIELYNRSSYTIDFTNTVLYAEDLIPYLSLSGTVSSGNYYLIERSNSSTTSEAENLATVFSGIGSGSGLSNSVEQLILVQSLGGNATTTLDSTPALSSCGGVWCGGEATTTPISMERKSTSTSGTDSNNWASNTSNSRNGTDAEGNDIYGSPKALNSATPPPAPGGGF